MSPPDSPLGEAGSIRVGVSVGHDCGRGRSSGPIAADGVQLAGAFEHEQRLSERSREVGRRPITILGPLCHRRGNDRVELLGNLRTAMARADGTGSVMWAWIVEIVDGRS